MNYNKIDKLLNYVVAMIGVLSAFTFLNKTFTGLREESNVM